MIRNYKHPDDAAAIWELISNDLGYVQTTKEACLKQMEKIANHHDYHTFVYVEDQAIIGFAGTLLCYAYENDDCYARLAALAVQADKRGKGVGTRLLQHVESFAKKQGCTDITLSSGMHREKAHLFYENQGYFKKGYSFLKKL